MTSPNLQSDDLFIVKKGRLARAWGRKSRDSILSTRLGLPDNSPRPEELERRRHLVEKALADQSLETLLQPIIDLKSRRAVGAEALSRFSQTPIRPPDVWFSDAASIGLGVELEMLAVIKALEHLPHLPSSLYLSINASVDTIVSEQFRDVVANTAASERVVLEVTEHTKVTDYAEFLRCIQELRSMGLRLAVDDAGAGYASFRHVLNLRPDVIKLDIALTRGIDKDPARQALGSALLTFGLNAYNAAIVAEGIETVGEFDTLRALGCPLGQGYYLGRPGRLRVPSADPGPGQALGRPAALSSQSSPASAPRPASANALSPLTPRKVIRLEIPRQEPATEDLEDSPVPENHRKDYAQLLALAAEIQDLDSQRERRALLV